MVVISIANRKGGTGKTTTAVNLATEMAARGWNTLLIDLDTQGHAAWGVGFKEITSFKYYVHEVFRKKDFDITKAIYKTPFENLFLSPAQVNFVPGEGENSPSRLKEAIEVIKKEGFDRIIIDTPPTLDIFLIGALSCSNVVIIPFLPHFLAAIGVKQMATLFYRVAVKYNNRLKLLGLVPIMLDRRLKMHKEVIKKLTSSFGKNRILRPIRTNVKLAEAFNAGMPVRFFAPKSPGAMDYYLLCEDVELLLREKFK